MANDVNDDALREFDALARQEAEERGEPYTSPFEEAAAAAGANIEATSPPAEFGEVPPPARKRNRSSGGKRGRPRKSDATRGKERARPVAGGVKSDATPQPGAHAAHVQGPPPPAAGAASIAAPGPLPPGLLAPVIRRLDAQIAARAGTEPLTDQETREGADVVAQLLHHYAPTVLNSDKPWVPAAAWVLAAYLPRLMDRASAPPAPAVALRTGAEGATAAPSSFPDHAATRAAAAAPPREPDVAPSDATPPAPHLWRKPLENLPDAPVHGHFE